MFSVAPTSTFFNSTFYYRPTVPEDTQRQKPTIPECEKSEVTIATDKTETQAARKAPL